MMLLQRLLHRKLSALSSLRSVDTCRAMTTAFILSPTQHISENNIVRCNFLIESAADNFSRSSLIACGVVTTAAAVIYQGSDCQKLGGTKRSYHNTSSCESNNGTNQNDNNNGKSNDSDSFFDFAQQWANEVLSPKGSSQSAEENQSNSVPLSTNNRAPEDALLQKLGLTRKKSFDARNVESPTSEGGNTNSTEENNTSVTQMMKSVMFKLQDEIQPSIPKSSASNDKAIPDHTELKRNDVKSSDFLSFADNVSSFFSRKSSNPDITEIIQQAQNIANNDNVSSTMSSSSSGFLSQVLYFQQNAKSIQRTLESSLGSYVSNDVNISDLFQSLPSFAAIHYYLEHQESIKTPSWKRRRHRFQPAVEVLKVNELNEALILSELSYADSVDEIRVGLDGLFDKNVGGNDKSKGGKGNVANCKAQWELLFCDTQSRPNEPSHFLAIQKNASEYDDTIHVLMVVRGTKSMGDLITDAMMEATDYEYEGVRGKAHVGITRSGEYLTKRHKKLLASLLQLSGKRKLDITLIGHSLGAGAASIAAMNMNTDKFAHDIGIGIDKSVKVSANVIGFGCPALLSRNISVMTRSFVTTVIADADVIPRMSGATIVNLLLDLNQFEYQDLAERDVEQALRELQGRFSDSSSPVSRYRQGSKQPSLSIDEDAIQKVMGYVHRGIEKISGEEGGTGKSSGKSKIAEEMTPCLFPPGTCIHFYRDGSGIDGTYVPCTFFDEIDVARTMVDDHLISSGYRKIFLNMMRDFHKDDHFKFERR